MDRYVEKTRLYHAFNSCLLIKQVNANTCSLTLLSFTDNMKNLIAIECLRIKCQIVKKKVKGQTIIDELEVKQFSIGSDESNTFRRIINNQISNTISPSVQVHVQVNESGENSNEDE